MNFFSFQKNINNKNNKSSIKKNYRFITIISLILVFTFLASCKGEQKYIIASDSDFAPFCFLKENELNGIDIDIMKEIAKDQNIKIEFAPYSFSSAVAALQTNQVDGIIAGMSITSQRQENYDFSEPYYDSKIAILSKKDNKEINSLEDIHKKKVSVKTASEGSRYAENIKNKYNISTFFSDDSSMMYEQVKSGNCDVCFEDDGVAIYNIKNGVELKIVSIIDEITKYGFATNKGKNKELLEKFNNGLSNIKQNGVYENILKKYLN